jgi:hypothetical protein
MQRQRAISIIKKPIYTTLVYIYTISFTFIQFLDAMKIIHLTKSREINEKQTENISYEYMPHISLIDFLNFSDFSLYYLLFWV